MHIYIFGSICRGDVKQDSDIDMLAIVSNHNRNLSKDTFSIYSYKRIYSLWQEGSPFAWHLHFESKLVYSPNRSDYILNLGIPNRYEKCLADCFKFYTIFKNAKTSLENSANSTIFDFSSIFLSIRNIATCFSIYKFEKGTFSRNSALNIQEFSITIPDNVYKTLSFSRLVSTRGLKHEISQSEIADVKAHLNDIERWMNILLNNIQ